MPSEKVYYDWYEMSKSQVRPKNKKALDTVLIYPLERRFPGVYPPFFWRSYLVEFIRFPLVFPCPSMFE